MPNRLTTFGKAVTIFNPLKVQRLSHKEARLSPRLFKFLIHTYSSGNWMSVKSIEYIESTLIYALLICVSALSLDIVLPAYPAISTEFSPLTASELQGNILFFVVGMLFGELLSGPLADRLGRRKVILGCAGVFGVGTLICMLSPAYQWLLLGRAIQGTGAAGFKICTRDYPGSSQRRSYGKTDVVGDGDVYFYPFYCACAWLLAGAKLGMAQYLQFFSNICCSDCILVLLATPRDSVWGTQC